MFPALIEDEDPFIEGTGSQSDQKISESINSLDVLSVNQLIESVSGLLKFCMVVYLRVCRFLVGYQHYLS